MSSHTQHTPEPGRLLVTACDTGSANAMAPMLVRLSRPYVVFAQAPAARVFDRWRIPYVPVPQFQWNELPERGMRILDEQQPRAVLAGTSWGPTVDKALTLAAREQGIPCAAVVEHWDLYRERFSKVADGKITDLDKFLPDRIWVNDEIACAEATAADLHGNVIDVVGQPHLEHQIGRLLAQGICKRNNTIVYISERVGEDFPNGSPLYRGFDEFKVLEALMNAADFSRMRILIKLHPQEPFDKYTDFIGSEFSGKVEVLKDANNAELIMTAGRIVGMYSMLLLEAALVREDVISFMPGGNSSMFIGNRLGATLPAQTMNELKLLLGDLQDAPALSITRFGSRFLGSSDRMIEAVERMMV